MNNLYHKQVWHAPERPGMKRGGKTYTVHRSWPKLLRVGLVVLPLIFIVYLVFFSPALAIRNISVDGNQGVSANDVVSAAQAIEQQHRLFIFPEANVLFFNTGQLHDALVNQFPMIMSATVVRRFPPALDVHLSERSTAAVWQSNNLFFGVSSDGKVIGAVDAPPAGSLIITDSTRIDPVVVGDDVMTGDTFATISQINEALKGAGGLVPIMYDVAEIPQYTLHVKTTSGVDVLFSTHLDIPTQINKLKVFAAEKAQQNKDWLKATKYIDLRFGSTRIYYQ